MQSITVCGTGMGPLWETDVSLVGAQLSPLPLEILDVRYDERLAGYIFAYIYLHDSVLYVDGCVPPLYNHVNWLFNTILRATRSISLWFLPNPSTFYPNYNRR